MLKTNGIRAANTFFQELRLPFAKFATLYASRWQGRLVPCALSCLLIFSGSLLAQQNTPVSPPANDGQAPVIRVSTQFVVLDALVEDRTASLVHVWFAARLGRGGSEWRWPGRYHYQRAGGVVAGRTGESAVGNTLFVIHRGFDGVQPQRGVWVIHRQRRMLGSWQVLRTMSAVAAEWCRP